ncbi:MAG: acylphosphatase [Streptosporangiaceae bacterium]
MVGRLDDIVDMRLTAWVAGRVQGVGFRWWVRASALELGLTGYAENLTDGRVKVVAEGPEHGCRELLGRLGAEGSPRRPGRVSGVTCRWAEAAGSLTGFAER